MNLLVLGSDSFIAQTFIKRISSNKVLGISRVSSSFSNEIVIFDFSKIEDKQFKGINCVLNFVAIVHRSDIKDPYIYDEINYKLAVLNAIKAKKAGVNLFVQISTIAVYGNVQNVSINTSYNPQSPYGSSKLKADTELLQLQDDTFKVAIIRPPLVYGGGKAPGNMMRLIKLVDKRIPLPFKGIDNRRDFINIYNLIQYLEIIVEKQLAGVFLVCDHESVSTEYLLNTISKCLKHKVLLIRVPNIILSLLKNLRPKDFDKLFGSLAIKTNFPYEESINRLTVEQGIIEMVKSYKNEK